MKTIKSIKKLERELEKTPTGWSGDTIFTAKAVLFIAYQQVEVVKLLRKLTKTHAHLRRKKWWEFWK